MPCFFLPSVAAVEALSEVGVGEMSQSRRSARPPLGASAKVRICSVHAIMGSLQKFIIDCEASREGVPSS
jgi:hypothetical protein